MNKHAQHLEGAFAISGMTVGPLCNALELRKRCSEKERDSGMTLPMMVLRFEGVDRCGQKREYLQQRLASPRDV